VTNILTIVAAVFVGGALGSTLRELMILAVPNPHGWLSAEYPRSQSGAAFLLGVGTALHARKVVSSTTHTFVGTGIMGALSTFSTFVFGVGSLMWVSLASAVVALAYFLVSLVLGHFAVIAGMRLGGRSRT
jgi:CrcB protein